MIQQNEEPNFEIFKDCLSTGVIQRLAPQSSKPPRKRAVKGRKNEIKPVERSSNNDGDGSSDATELSDFVEYLAEEVFINLSAELRTLSYAKVQDDSSLQRRFDIPLETSTLEIVMKHLPLTVLDSLSSYGLIESADDPEHFFTPIIESFITAITAPPPEHTPAITASRPDGCEICSREHIPLTYHHLIPRQIHAKAVKRGWHRDWELNKVAWLCRACHSYVHSVATNEELAREFYDVEKLLEREDVQKFATWVSKVRWKAR